MLPSRASSRKQIRHRLKSRIKPRGRPHLKQRRTLRLENFGFRRALTTSDLLAIKLEEFYPELVEGLPRLPEYAPQGESIGTSCSGACAIHLGTVPTRDPVLPANLWLKNKAPCEAH